MRKAAGAPGAGLRLFTNYELRITIWDASAQGAFQQSRRGLGGGLDNAYALPAGRGRLTAPIYDLRITISGNSRAGGAELPSRYRDGIFGRGSEI